MRISDSFNFNITLFFNLTTNVVVNRYGSLRRLSGLKKIRDLNGIARSRRSIETEVTIEKIWLGKNLASIEFCL
jgi:hypothetical protein